LGIFPKEDREIVTSKTGIPGGPGHDWQCSKKTFENDRVLYGISLIKIVKQILQIILIELRGPPPLGALTQLPHLASRSYATVFIHWGMFCSRT